MAASYDEVVAGLTGVGGPFEIVTETVRGLPMKIFKNREKSMREKVANAGLRGDAEFVVQGDRRIGYGEFARRGWGAAARHQRGASGRPGQPVDALRTGAPIP